MSEMTYRIGGRSGYCDPGPANKLVDRRRGIEDFPAEARQAGTCENDRENQARPGHDAADVTRRPLASNFELHFLAIALDKRKSEALILNELGFGGQIVSQAGTAAG